MKEVVVHDAELQRAAEEGRDAFIKVFTDAIYHAIDGELTSETMAELNADQITLLAYGILRDEVMDGGFVQLIHNGYGPFFFRNPFAKMIKLWGLKDLSKLVYNVGSHYGKTHDAIEKDCTDEEFMALFEQFPEYDDYDDEFVENEEQWTSEIAHYIDDHIEQFARIE